MANTQSFQQLTKHPFAVATVLAVLMALSRPFPMTAIVHMADASVPFSIGAIGTIRRFTETRRSRLGEKLIGLADQVRNTIVTGYLDAERVN